MNNEVSTARLARFRAGIEKGSFLVRNTGTIAWLTAFDGVFDGEQAHALLVTDDRVVLHTDSRYSAACKRAAAGGPIEIDSTCATHARWLADQHPILPLNIEDDITLAEYRAIDEAISGVSRNRFIEQHCYGAKIRSVKDSFEIERLKAAQEITDAAFSHIVSYIQTGMTERHVRIELEDFICRHGAQGLAFPSIVATGSNGANPHAIPGETKLEAGQCVVMDFGARAKGYCSDMTRVVFLGEPDERKRDAYRVLREANETVEAMLKPGVTGACACELADEVLAQGGYKGKMGHGLGHGVGIDIHEQPTLSSRNTKPLEVGNVVTVEPGIYLDGDFGMRLEDCGVITPTGYQVFTQSTHEMVII